MKKLCNESPRDPLRCNEGMRVNWFMGIFVILLVFLGSEKLLASEMSFCFSSDEIQTELMDTSIPITSYREWYHEKYRFHEIANQLKCEKLEEFRDTITGTIVYLSILNGVVLQYTPYIHAKVFVSSSIGFLTHLNLYLKNAPCERGEENFKRILSEGICEAARDSDMALKCEAVNSEFVLPIEWENGINYRNMCEYLMGIQGV